MAHAALKAVPMRVTATNAMRKMPMPNSTTDAKAVIELLAS